MDWLAVLASVKAKKPFLPPRRSANIEFERGRTTKKTKLDCSTILAKRSPSPEDVEIVSQYFPTMTASPQLRNSQRN